MRKSYLRGYPGGSRGLDDILEHGDSPPDVDTEGVPVQVITGGLSMDAVELADTATVVTTQPGIIKSFGCMGPQAGPAATVRVTPSANPFAKDVGRGLPEERNLAPGRVENGRTGRTGEHGPCPSLPYTTQHVPLASTCP